MCECCMYSVCVWNLYIIIAAEEKSSEGAPGSSAAKDNTQSTSGDKSASDSTSTPGVFTSPGLQSIMQQMMQNPQLVQEMFNAPYMQSMMDALAANPEVASQVNCKIHGYF